MQAAQEQVSLEMGGVTYLGVLFLRSEPAHRQSLIGTSLVSFDLVNLALLGSFHHI